MVLVLDVGQVEAHFGPFGDSVNLNTRCMDCVERAIGLEIIFGALVETPRCRGLSGSSFRSIWR
jgi:hypothetical protein